MKQSIHLIDPVNGHSMMPEFIKLRCGRVINPLDVITTTSNDLVTCIKCRSYINNPWRVLRKYGKVKVLESFFVVLWADYGYPFDVVATIDTPLEWHVTISRKDEIHDVRRVEATSMADLGFQLVAIVEKEIKEFKKSTNNS
jgi:hypothetical protein